MAKINIKRTAVIKFTTLRDSTPFSSRTEIGGELVGVFAREEEAKAFINSCEKARYTYYQMFPMNEQVYLGTFGHAE